MALTAYADADHAGCQDTRRSTSGSAQFLGDNSMPTTTATMIGQLEQNIADLVDANQALEERLDKKGNRIHQLETQDLSKLIREQTVEFIDSISLHPPPPPSGASGASGTTIASDSA
ncbi:hypothetical protein Tco_0028874 [Tanacetum coccineum]